MAALSAAKTIVRRTLDGDVPDTLPADIHPVVRRAYRARRVYSAGELDRSAGRLLAPSGLMGIDTATAVLAEALRRGTRILVVADFDTDGATSCALMIRALRAMGAADVDYLVPNRFEFGYGLTPEIVTLAAQREPGVIVTVDNGISSVEGVRAANACGIDVVITDHHLPGPALPAAAAIVNPNQPGDMFESKSLAGVGVAFYLMVALRARLRAAGWFAQKNLPEPNLARWLDLVAVGTVADLVPLDRNNRILVSQGLARIRAGRSLEGVRALVLAAGRHVERVSATDLGFCVAPRLNAAGRLSDMSLGIECLLTDDAAAATATAAQLDALNRERRGIEAQMQQQALSAVESLHFEVAALPRGLCLYDDTWHQGVIGLVASRLKDRFHRPVIAFAPANGEEIKGSARSIPGLHIRDALDAIAACAPGLLTRFGGHAMAAGLTLPRAHFERFREAFDDQVGRTVSDDDLHGRIFTDGGLTGEELSIEVAQALREAGPWGQNFPEPLFDGVFEIERREVVGERHLRLGLRHEDGKRVQAIGFQFAPQGTPPDWHRVHVAYRLDINEYRGTRALQLVMEHMVPVA